jgi:glutamyl-tRNA synthetase
MHMSVRVRYAPSPTGLQHIGGVRTALFNYFFARAQGGTFILRVEDTDRERYNEEALQDLYDTFDWLGIAWDEGPNKGGPYGPYVQSERFHLYEEYAHRLVERGNAYYCYCSEERLEQLREEQKKEKKQQGYDRHCRNLSDEQRREYEEQGIKPVIRFAVPLEGETSFEDVILGRVKKKNKDIPPDPVLLKSDGFPTYHLANVVDDHLMEISHILRAQEWIPSGPLHVQLYKAFGWTPPVYCHLPMVMGKDGQKLSKRHGATAVREFRRQGYLPEALINYISLLGWSWDDKREFFTRDELEQLFTLEKLNKAPGVFDYKKLEWFNGQYIRAKDDEELIGLILPYLQAEEIVSDPPAAGEMEIIRRMMPLMKERLHFLSDIVPLSRFLFSDVKEYRIEDVIPKKMDAAGTLELLKAGRELVARFPELGAEKTEELFREKAEELGVKLGAMLMPIRVAITGSKVSPPLFGSIELLGIEPTLERIDRVVSLLEGEVENG